MGRRFSHDFVLKTGLQLNLIRTEGPTGAQHSTTLERALVECDELKGDLCASPLSRIASDI